MPVPEVLLWASWDRCVNVILCLVRQATHIARFGILLDAGIIQVGIVCRSSDRNAFEDASGAMMLRPDFSAMIRRQKSCAELLNSGNKLEQIRRRSMARIPSAAIVSRPDAPARQSQVTDIGRATYTTNGEF